jgi:hypothetical protein
MIKQFDWNFSTNKELFSDLKVTELLDNKKPMTKMFRYDLEFNEDTHWKLVQLGALKKMHQEDFVEELITCVIEVLSMDEEEKEEEKEEEEDTQVNHIGDINKMVPPPVATDEELNKIWDSKNSYREIRRALYDLGIEHGQARSQEVAEPAPVAWGLVDHLSWLIAEFASRSKPGDDCKPAAVKIVAEVAGWLRGQGAECSSDLLEQEAGR